MSAPEGTQSIVRAVRLLKLISARAQPGSLRDLASELGLSKPTVHRMLGALAAEGLVERGSRGFILGAGVVALGAQALASSNLRVMARRHLERLASETGETATLEIPSGESMLILDEVRGGQVIGANIEVGTRWPMSTTSTGKAFKAAIAGAVEPFAISENELEAGFSAVGAVVRSLGGGAIAALSLGGPSERLGKARLEELGVQVRDAANELSATLGG